MGYVELVFSAMNCRSRLRLHCTARIVLFHLRTKFRHPVALSTVSYHVSHDGTGLHYVRKFFSIPESNWAVQCPELPEQQFKQPRNHLSSIVTSNLTSVFLPVLESLIGGAKLENRGQFSLT